MSQTGVQVEVIVVDDGSTDDSREILEKYRDQIRTYFQENKGAPAARNLGWRNATADYIKFLDSDDALLPGVLEMQLKQIEKLNENEIPYGEAIWTDEKLNPLKGYPVKPIAPGQDPVHHILTQNPLTSAPLHRKVLLEKVNGFDESLVKGQEFDLHLRIVLSGNGFTYFNKKIYLFRQSKSIDRISNTSFSKNHKELYNMLVKQHGLINEINGNQQEINQILSKRYLEFAKSVVLDGGYIQSIKFFIKYFGNIHLNRKRNGN